RQPDSLRELSVSFIGLHSQVEEVGTVGNLEVLLVKGLGILAATRAMQQLSLEDREVSRMTDQFSWDEVLSWWVYPHLRCCKLQMRKLWKQQVNASTAAGVADVSALGLEDGDAKAPGGGKAPKDGTQSEATGDDSSSKDLVQSLKISALRADLDSASQALKVVCVEGRKGLIDGGATSCLRTAYTTELTLPTIPVKLACGSCDLHINAYGTLLSRTPVSPIISVKALLKLGYRIDWNASRCRVSHPKFGELSVDTRTGCPEVDEEVALDLINQYELYVGRHDNRCARLKCIIEDLKEKGLEDLLELIRAGDSHADAAFSVYIDRLFPELNAELKERCVVSLQDAVEETWTWNRRTRRRCMKSQGIVIHAFCEQAKKALEHVSERWDFVHLPVNAAEDLLNDSTYRYLLQQARDGRVRGVVGSPPSRTFSTARYLQDGGNKGLRPIRVPGESVGEYGVRDLTCQEQAQRNVDDTLLMRFLVLTAFSVDSNKGLGIPVPACLLENPCPENEMPAGPQEISEDGRQASVWNTPEWELLEGKIGMSQFRFFQGPLGHCKRRPTCIGTNIDPDPDLIECSVPVGQVEYIPRKDFRAVAERWSEWAPGLVQAASSMMHRAFAQMKATVSGGSGLKKIDSGFIHHLQQNHTPYRNDCSTCIRGAAKRKQHRRVLTPQAWTLSVDTAGPFVKGRDEHSSKVKYLIVGVLSVPVLAVGGEEVDKPLDADPNPVPPEGGAINDAEWLAGEALGVEEADPELSTKEISEAKATWNEWEKLVKCSREDWLAEAQSQVLPKVEIVDFVYVETVERKTHGEVLTAIGRMHARARAEGFDVRRLHSDRGREFNNKPLRDWCARHSVHKTLAVAEEHQGNGRAEGAIMRVKSKARIILEEADSEKTNWPLAAKLATHELKNAARRKLNIPVQESLPYGTKVQVISRSWKRETWEARTATAFVRCPSADMSRGWVVETEDGKLLTTSKLFPSMDHGKVSFSSTGAAVDLDAPDYRLRDKTSVRSLEPQLLCEPLHESDRLAKQLYEDGRFQPKDLATLAVAVSKLEQDSARMVRFHSNASSGVSLRRCNFLAGAFSYGGMTGMKASTRDHPWVTRYLTRYLSNHTDGMFAGVGLILNTDHQLHRDVHNQKGVENIVLPVVTSGGGLWIQNKTKTVADSEELLVKQSPHGKPLVGQVHTYSAHEVVKFDASVWHESVSPSGQQLLLIGYTPRSLHKLCDADRQLLWSTGFTLLPASKDEFWGYDRREGVLTKHHRVPRKQMYAPSDREWLPVDRKYFGDVRYCIQQFRDGDPVRTMCLWRRGRGRASSQAWTGTSSFKLRDPSSVAAAGGGESDGLKGLQESHLKISEVSQMPVITKVEEPEFLKLSVPQDPQEISSGLVCRDQFQGSAAGSSVAYSRNLLEPKGVELEEKNPRKITVSQEFPSCCPREVALQCVSAELQRLQKVVQGDGVTGESGNFGNGSDWEVQKDEQWFGFRVPARICGLEPCPSTRLEGTEHLELHEVSWPMQVNVSGALDWVAGQHREVQSLLQAVDDGGNEFSVEGDKPYWEALEALESQGRELQRIEDELLQSACPVVLRSLSVTETIGSEDGELSAAAEGTGSDGDTSSDPPSLHTKIIGADQVRREPEKWIPSMTDEYQSLVSKTGAVEELSEGEYKVLAEDPNIILEIIPGKLVYVHKTSGRRKSRIVGCGNFCRGDSSERCELYASGAGAESLRLMIRKCALQPEWMLASVDVRTAFLQAPLLEKQRDGKRLVTIVRVPSILRETGVTTCRFWKVRKALYGLASAPKSWSNHRDKVLAGLRIPCKGGILRLSKMMEDANLLHIVKFPDESESVGLVEGQKVGVIALYVDDILIGAECSICEAVIKALQDQWELSSPEWLAKPGDQMKFAGYELQKTSEGVRLHQESYVQDLLEQNEGLITGEERAPAIKMGSFDDVESDVEQRELTKRAQGLIGQLLWLAGRTRPDLAYGVSMAAQKIASSPREALARAEHLVKYLRYAPGVGLHYKEADGNCGKWDQLRHKQTGDTLDVYTDASFAADEQCRSFGSVHLYWGGALVSWASARQTLIAAHTAESELYSLAEGHLMGKAFRPTVAALMDVCEQNIACHLYCDNAAAVQLCMLEAGSWRTRHLRLRGAIIRQDLENDMWALAHLEGVFMPSVAAMNSTPSGFMSTFLALLFRQRGVVPRTSYEQGSIQMSAREAILDVHPQTEARDELGSGGAQGSEMVYEDFVEDPVPTGTRVEAHGAHGVDSSAVVEPLLNEEHEEILQYYADLRGAYVQAEEVPEGIREDAVRDRLIEALGPPRAPTVPRPPGYPGDDLEWFRAPEGYDGVEFDDGLDT
ncbi:RE1, partial [Symbiodinium necroappetens]